MVQHCRGECIGRPHSCHRKLQWTDRKSAKVIGSGGIHTGVGGAPGPEGKFPPCRGRVVKVARNDPEAREIIREHKTYRHRQAVVAVVVIKSRTKTSRSASRTKATGLPQILTEWSKKDFTSSPRKRWCGKCHYTGERKAVWADPLVWVLAPGMAGPLSILQRWS